MNDFDPESSKGLQPVKAARWTVRGEEVSLRMGPLVSQSNLRDISFVSMREGIVSQAFDASRGSVQAVAE